MIVSVKLQSLFFLGFLSTFLSYVCAYILEHRPCRLTWLHPNLYAP